MTPPDDLTESAVRPLLRGRLGTPYLWHAECASTQDVLRGSGLPEGAVAVAEHQTAGRGRSGRRWSDVPGAALLVSVLLRPPPDRRRQELSLVAGLATAEAIERATGVATGLKWPNDVVADGRKVAGILLEADDDGVVCGIGVNVNGRPETLPAGAWAPPAALCELAGREVERAPLLAGLLAALDERYDAWLAGGLAPLHAALAQRDWLAGRRVRAGGVDGIGAGIASDGRYAVTAQDGATVLVESGEVEPVPLD